MLPDLPQTEAAIVEMTNAFRREHKLAAVSPNKILVATAKAFAEYLAKTGKFAHEADGREPAARAVAQGYRYCLVSENLAMNLDSRGFESRQLAREAVEGWKKSPGHRANMLQPGVTEIGVGVARAQDRSPKFISVQVFGRPESLKVQFSIENRAGVAVTYTLGDETETLPVRGSVTHTSCDASGLSFVGTGPTLQVTPSNGDRFVARMSGGTLTIVKERK